MKNILAEAEVTEKFDSEFAIYDLPEFLRAVELFEKPALKFNGGSNVTIASANNKQSIKYFFADKSVIVAPTKAINMPDQYVSFTLKKEDFARLQRAITTLNLPDVAVVGDGKNIKLVATDKKNKSSNDYSEIIGETDKKFNAYFKAENLKIIGVVVGTIGVFTLLANSIPQVQSEVPQDLSFGADVSAAELTASGELLYGSAGGCTACHGLGTRAPNLLTGDGSEGPIGARCGDRVPGESCKEYLYLAMVEPNVFLVDGYSPIMPDMRRSLSNDQIWAIVAYLEAQGGEVTVTGADINQGGGESGSGASTAVAANSAAGPASTSTDPMDILNGNACLGCHILDGAGAPIGPSFDAVSYTHLTLPTNREV